MYQYKECGLDNVYLVNGYTKTETPYGETVSVQDIDQLHKVIAENLLGKPELLTGDEFRFLRVELSLSQKRFGDLYGKDSQTIATWEKGKTELPKGADRVIRMLYQDKLRGSVQVTSLLQFLDELDNKEWSSNFDNKPDIGWVPHTPKQCA